ncbi:TetR/AcrR family transcriptional regulator [Achromobacter deleyi]|uniref:TetR/AcrR family transcriptional regulator n=1 Tax=Achromobacter deleyi TaxID=1353891 RepID=UPI0014930CEB|nr:TetR/AcrR family transcriptional regulator [Achromobacter deleyi]QVQ24707.1 TetR/AcrR family transcriptional regulator [Achromobacter deleyi]UIP20243.1 TetR/AcrR family transcriptional regulator [Achromobacter deleyi]
MAERGRPRNFDRAQALQKAMEVFWSKGYEGASLTDLTVAMGINSPSLYGAFGSKEGLFREAVELYRETEGGSARRALLAAPTARDAIQSMLLASAERFTAPGLPPGCMIVLGAPAGCVNHASVGNFLGDNRREMQSRILARLNSGASQGELPPGADLKGLAAFYTTVLHGMSIQARDGATRKTLQAVARQAMCAWDALAVDRPPPSEVPPGRSRS